MTHRLDQVARRFDELARCASRDAAATVVAAVHEEGARFRDEVRKAVNDPKLEAAGAIDAAVQCFGSRVEALLEQSVRALWHSANGAGTLQSIDPVPRPSEAVSDAELEALLRTGFKSLGCTTVAVLERCRLGDRGVSAELPDGTWVQAWISGGSVLWVLPTIPQLTELVNDPAIATMVLTSLLQYGADRKESFFLTTQPPFAVGYKFGPLRPQALATPAAIGDFLEDAITMMQQQAKIISLESLAGRVPAVAGAPQAQPIVPKAPASLGLSANPQSSAAMVESGQPTLAPTAIAAAAATLNGPCSAEVIARKIASGDDGGQAAPAATDGREATAAVAGAQSARDSNFLAVNADGEDQQKSAQWFDNVFLHYLEPLSAGEALDGSAESPAFNMSVQDTPQRKVGMHFIKKTGLDFEHFKCHTSLYKDAAKAKGVGLGIALHPRGHIRVSFWRLARDAGDGGAMVEESSTMQVGSEVHASSNESGEGSMVAAPALAIAAASASAARAEDLAGAVCSEALGSVSDVKHMASRTDFIEGGATAIPCARGGDTARDAGQALGASSGLSTRSSNDASDGGENGAALVSTGGSARRCDQTCAEPRASSTRWDFPPGC